MYLGVKKCGKSDRFQRNFQDDAEQQENASYSPHNKSRIFPLKTRKKSDHLQIISGVARSKVSIPYFRVTREEHQLYILEILETPEIFVK